MIVQCLGLWVECLVFIVEYGVLSVGAEWCVVIEGDDCVWDERIKMRSPRFSYSSI